MVAIRLLAMFLARKKVTVELRRIYTVVAVKRSDLCIAYKVSSSDCELKTLVGSSVKRFPFKLLYGTGVQRNN